jgi:hypothetical protein
MARNRKAEPPVLTDLTAALRGFAFPSRIVQSSDHIRRLHWYTACRLVLEGGFDPDDVVPRPPIVVETRGRSKYLHHDPSSARTGERVVLGGLKTKNIDVTVAIRGIGPVVAVSLKGSHNAFRNLTNRMEEAAGDCTNLHMSYPALVYGFWHVLRANEENDPEPSAHFALTDGRYETGDVALLADGRLSEGVERYAHALERLSDREDLRDHPSKYEACALTLVSSRGGPTMCGVYASFPLRESILDYNRMFARLYRIYDERYVFQAPALRTITARNIWNPESPLLADTVATGGAFSEFIARTD